MPSSIQIFAGQTAYRHVQQHGLQAADIAVIPAAAGGPKGLILQALDQWLFGEWLPSAPRERTLIGASIGAWRMAAASCADPVAAFERLGNLYCEQRYPVKPSAAYVTEVIQNLLQAFIEGHEHEIVHQPLNRLHILTNRGRGLLDRPSSAHQAKWGFATAALSNLLSRSRMAKHMERVVIGDNRDPLFWLKARFDAFETHFCTLTENNLAPSLLASGTLPLVMQAVSDIPQAPSGSYWDGGMIDYHLDLPYSRLAGNKEGGLVLYPHFSHQIIPGWLDKALAWRRAGKGPHRHWVDNLMLVSPSAHFLKTLSRGKLPDRQDFFYYDTDHAFRIQNWRLAISESGRLRDDFAEFVRSPDLSAVKALNF